MKFISFFTLILISSSLGGENDQLLPIGNNDVDESFEAVPEPRQLDQSESFEAVPEPRQFKQNEEEDKSDEIVMGIPELRKPSLNNDAGNSANLNELIPKIKELNEDVEKLTIALRILEKQKEDGKWPNIGTEVIPEPRQPKDVETKEKETVQHCDILQIYTGKCPYLKIDPPPPPPIRTRALFNSRPNPAPAPQPAPAPAPQPAPASSSESNDCTCGIRNEETRIVGGKNAEQHEFPWMVTLSSRKSHFCGGAIIDKEWILTAAHCIGAAKSPSDLRVNVGDHILNVNTESAKQKFVGVSRIIVHKGYNSQTQDSDIALVKLSTKLVYSREVSPVCLPFKLVNMDVNGKTCTAAGWGTIESGGPRLPALQKADMPMLSTSECQKKFGHNSKMINNNMICTFATGKDTCQGDSGGPIVYKHTDSRYYAMGVVSWGIGCANPKYPGVYVKNTNYLPWIQSTTGANFCK